MVRKRGISPLGNTFGSHQAQQLAAQANIESLTQLLSSELVKAGQKTDEYLRRQFGSESVGQSVVWQLSSGKTATFNEVILSYQQVKDETVVTFDINGRDQLFLTPESLADLNSLEYQQFYPAVGRELNGQIDILDGSRRRAWMLLQKGRINNFRVLVTQDELSMSDAKALAKQLQTAKEHNIREVGLQCITLQKAHKNITQSEIAKLMGISQAKVSKSIKAANIDLRLIQLFSVVNDLSYRDYNLLKKVMLICDNESSLEAFFEIMKDKSILIKKELPIGEQNYALMQILKKELKIVESKKEQNKDTQVIALAEFKSASMFARKRIKGRNFSYEFGRLSRDVQVRIDDAIKDILLQVTS